MMTVFANHTDAVRNGRFTPDGMCDARVCTCMLAQSQALTWISHTSKDIKACRMATRCIYIVQKGQCVSPHAAGKAVVTCAEDGSVIMWDPKTSEPTLKMAPGVSCCRACAGMRCLKPETTAIDG